MMTFVAIIHILIALVLIVLVLLQDSKGGGALGIGGGSNSILGATGAQTLAAKMTRWTAVIFALTSVSLSVISAQERKSVVDSAPISAPAVPTAATSAPPATAPTTSAPAEAAKAPETAAAAPAATQAPATEKK